MEPLVGEDDAMPLPEFLLLSGGPLGGFGERELFHCLSVLFKDPEKLIFPGQQLLCERKVTGVRSDLGRTERVATRAYPADGTTS